MSRLKAGYWRAITGQVLEVMAERDGVWFGRWVSSNATFVRTTSHGWDYEYLGPTLPPEPGEGWRLVTCEPLTSSDEWSSESLPDHWRNNWDRESIGLTPKQHAEKFPDAAAVWFRRRVAPTPPTPPEGWEVLPDGTPWQKGFMRFASYDKQWSSDCDLGDIKSGGNAGCFLYYARRIAKQEWVATGNIQLMPSGVPGNCRIFTTGGMMLLCRELRCGDETKWVPVESQP